MHSVTMLYQSLSDSQQRTDLTETLKKVLETFMPLDVDNLRYPEHIVTKGRPKGTKNARLPSAFELVQNQKQSISVEQKAHNEVEQEADIIVPNTLKNKKRKKNAEIGDTEDLWPKKKNHRKEMEISVP